MKISSPAFQNEGPLPSKYTCDGDNMSPPLAISEVPENAKSLALILDDPDAPAGTFVHWILFNIDPTTTEIAENSVPPNAIEGLTSYGKASYGSPCPPSGTHRYFFKLYALDEKLTLSSGANAKDLEQAMNGHILAQSQLIANYSR